MDVNVVAIVLPEPARRIETDGVRPMGFCEGDKFGEPSRSRDFDAVIQQSARYSTFPVVCKYRHSDDSRSASLKQQSDRSNDIAGMFCHEKFVAAVDERGVYIAKVRIQRLIDKSEVLPQSLKHDVTRSFLIVRSKLSNGQIFWYSCRLLPISCMASRITSCVSMVRTSSEKENCMLLPT